ncbi:SDR family oxidoreductase [Botrimarina hoheduenensis]|uniref:2-keto-3-deoxy-L-fuconate dehydrogenase n=1 Tax=Botrimarina hoheduenensis TaxID=2528000 RepID=A0A5C5WBX4_9BACT|nr:SDR family oxidoreductase [Botrimarina hoheduenensis]TWT47561.1 2-keto-3-deoxy-L-fuconate dehydrogenase [Botrimarina hoheduenensis]
MADRLKDKKVLVTAAGQGIGRVCAEAFAREGAAVLATDINEAALESLARAMPAVRTMRLDMRDPAAISALASAEGAFDVLLNAAGYVHHGTILDCEEQDWAFSFDLNVTAMYRLTRALLPAMLDAGGGSIVNIASVASSVTGVPNRFAYGASKAAILGLTKAIAADFVKQGIRCNAICPGTVESPSLEERMRAQAGDYDAVRAAFVARQPMGRLGKPEEVASLAVYLASDEASYTTGAIHLIDGGWCI